MNTSTTTPNPNVAGDARSSHAGALAAVELISTVLAVLGLQAVIRVAFDRDAEPLWGLFRFASDSVGVQVTMVVVLGAIVAATAIVCHVLRRRSARASH